MGDLDNIVQYASDNKIDHAYGFCIAPTELDVRYSNKLTVDAKEKLSASANTLLQSIGTTCASLKIILRRGAMSAPFSIDFTGKVTKNLSSV